MRKRGKVAVTIAADVLAEVERERKRTGENRSAVFERALTAYLADRRRVNAERSYVDGYRHAPESAAEVRVASATAVAALATEPWDAQG
jgi:metal-responsive CopG/Arc/MetJ family transcriptional regulator